MLVAVIVLMVLVVGAVVVWSVLRGR